MFIYEKRYIRLCKTRFYQFQSDQGIPRPACTSDRSGLVSVDIYGFYYVFRWNCLPCYLRILNPLMRNSQCFKKRECSTRPACAFGQSEQALFGLYVLWTLLGLLWSFGASKIDLIPTPPPVGFTSNHSQAVVLVLFSLCWALRLLAAGIYSRFVLFGIFLVCLVGSMCLTGSAITSLGERKLASLRFVGLWRVTILRPLSFVYSFSWCHLWLWLSLDIFYTILVAESVSVLKQCLS